MQFNVHYKEKLYLTIMTAVSIMIYGGILLNITQSWFYLLYVGLFLLLNFFLSALFIGMLKGNGIKVHQKQFPEIFEILEAHSQKLGFSKIPDIYILQGHGILNALATKFVARDYVILYSDVLEVAYQEGKDAVSFIIGHELGHIKRNHLGLFKSCFLLPARLIPALASAYSRACEYTCDTIGYNLCPQGAAKGLLVLAAGKKLYKNVNLSELLLHGKFERGFSMWLAEIFSSHPALINRLAEINQLNRYNLTPETTTFISPPIDIKQLDQNT